MNAKMKDCFTPHAITHNLFGIGLGLILAALVPALQSVIVGVVVVVVALVLDTMRK